MKENENRRMEQMVEEVFQQGEVLRKVRVVIRRRVARLVEQLTKNFPDHIDIIQEQFEGAAQELVSLREKAKRLQREEEDQSDRG